MLVTQEAIVVRQEFRAMKEPSSKGEGKGEDFLEVHCGTLKPQMVLPRF